jgi:hypothetical protein
VRALPCSPAPRRLGPLFGATAVVLALTGGCGFPDALAHPATPSGEAGNSGASATAAAPATSTSAAGAAADLAGSADDRPASLAVSVTGRQPGVPPVTTVDGPLTGECSLDPAATQYARLAVVFTDRSLPTKQRGISSNLRLDVTTVGGDGVGVVVDSANENTYCDGSGALPARSELQSQNLSDEHQTMTVYVVARTSPSAPDPLQGVTVELRGLRHHPDSIDARDWNWDVQQVTAGSACADDPRSLCVPLS